MNRMGLENKSLNDEIVEAQDSLRLSANQQIKLAKEVKEMKVQMERNNAESETYRQKIHKLVSENTNLSDEVRDAQENLRLSASQMGKLQNELKVLCNENEELKRMLN